MTNESQEHNLDKLYAQFGRTAEMAQVMELEAGNLTLAYVMIAFDTNNLTNEDKLFLKSLSEDVDRRTFGYLIKSMKKSMAIDQTIKEAIDAALEKRNHLIHHFFRTHNFAIYSEEGRERMIEELAEYHKTFSHAHALLHGMTQALNEMFGNLNMTEEQAKKLMDKAKQVDI